MPVGLSPMLRTHVWPYINLFLLSWRVQAPSWRKRELQNAWIINQRILSGDSQNSQQKTQRPNSLRLYFIYFWMPKLKSQYTASYRLREDTIIFCRPGEPTRDVLNTRLGESENLPPTAHHSEDKPLVLSTVERKGRCGLITSHPANWTVSSLSDLWHCRMQTYPATLLSAHKHTLYVWWSSHAFPCSRNLKLESGRVHFHRTLAAPYWK